MTLERELDVARIAALEAAALVLRYRGTALTVDTKTGDEPVTVADREASALILTHLARAFPRDSLLSEEVPDDGARLRESRVWMVDPIDGTRDFIDGDTGFCVMIGLCIDGRPRLGVVAVPATGELFGATLDGNGKGSAFREGPDHVRTNLTTSTLAAPPGIRLVASKSHRTRDVDTFRRALAIEDEINVGSIGVKVAMVADARRDLYVYPGSRTKIWDTCAPEAILLGAGGNMTDVRGQPLRYTDPDLMNRHGIVASNGPLHDRVLEALAGLIGQRQLPG
jgi:3'(2'), 5'-bisphosphate nucleotidase